MFLYLTSRGICNVVSQTKHSNHPRSATRISISYRAAQNARDISSKSSAASPSGSLTWESAIRAAIESIESAS